ncbi:MAG: phosphatidylserine decarboxylase family protein [Planctomycetes bacterium]|nr:phosphatidylserine decarboxylase family protein [Planctomycetota bacterium]
MRLAREGIREMAVGTMVLGLLGVAAWIWFWPAAVPCAVVWVWLIAFFRDPQRTTTCKTGEFCSPADGTVTEITQLEHDPDVGGPALRIGVFLSLFNVHANRSPCAARVCSVRYEPGKFLDARHSDSGRLNEANTLTLEPEGGLRGPVVVRQVAGKVARRIICHARVGTRLAAGERFGMIKFGSRTELILPAEGSESAVTVGQKVAAGTTIIARQVSPKLAEAEKAAQPMLSLKR